MSRLDEMVARRAAEEAAAREERGKRLEAEKRERIVGLTAYIIRFFGEFWDELGPHAAVSATMDREEQPGPSRFLTRVEFTVNLPGYGPFAIVATQKWMHGADGETPRPDSPSILLGFKLPAGNNSLWHERIVPNADAVPEMLTSFLLDTRERKLKAEREARDEEIQRLAKTVEHGGRSREHLRAAYDQLVAMVAPEKREAVDALLREALRNWDEYDREEEEKRRTNEALAAFEADYRVYHRRLLEIHAANRQILTPFQEGLIAGAHDLWLLTFAFLGVSEDEGYPTDPQIATAQVVVASPDPDESGFWPIYKPGREGVFPVRYHHVVSVEWYDPECPLFFRPHHVPEANRGIRVPVNLTLAELEAGLAAIGLTPLPSPPAEPSVNVGSWQVREAIRCACLDEEKA